MRRFCSLSGNPPKNAWHQPIIKGAHWIKEKRLSDKIDALHAGLMPPGFSAEHLGTNDYFYWDDFWSIAGLLSAASLAEELGDTSSSPIFRQEADTMMRAVERSLERSAHRRARPGLPASPYRRMDSGAIGSLVVDYPLQLWPAGDSRVVDTVNLLMQISFVKGAFFQNMIHSGLNAYLTLHMAQVLLRAGDSRFFDLVRAVAGIASPTGQWPEAVHPHTGGGCMGDGQHAWAAAEWVLMIRNMFVREEGSHLILASGVADELLTHGDAIEFGPAPTPWGPVTVLIEPKDEEVRVSWKGKWHKKAPPIEVRLPGKRTMVSDNPNIDCIIVPRQAK